MSHSLSLLAVFERAEKKKRLRVYLIISSGVFDILSERPIEGQITNPCTPSANVRQARINCIGERGSELIIFIILHIGKEKQAKNRFIEHQKRKKKNKSN